MTPAARGTRWGLAARLLAALVVVLAVAALTAWLVASAVGPGLFHEHMVRAGLQDNDQAVLHAERAFRDASAVSLALALGLSDVIQSSAGGVRLDTMFVDEGFGSLDEEALNQAMKALVSLTQGNRLVGIISHVQALQESIPSGIVVKKDAHGSTLRVVYD